MSGRVLPTEPGWWWAAFDPLAEEQVVVWVGERDGRLFARYGMLLFPIANEAIRFVGPVLTTAEVAALRAEVASLQARISDFEKYTEILCPDCGAPTDGLPDGWPA